MKTYNVKYLKPWDQCKKEEDPENLVYGIKEKNWASDIDFYYPWYAFRFPHNLIVWLFGTWGFDCHFIAGVKK